MINPMNGRTLIKKNGRLYRQYVTEGLIVHDYDKDPSVIQMYDPESEDWKKLKIIHDKILKPTHACVRGRGIYKNYLVKYKMKNKVKVVKVPKYYLE
jgi:hypothetical protein